MEPVTRPRSALMSVAARLIISDARAPNMRRLSVSRPSASVPNGWSIVPPAQTGGARLLSRSCASGLCGAMRPAKIATKATSPSPTSPATAVFRRVSRPRRRRRACTGAPATPTSSRPPVTTSLSGSMPDAGVEHRVDHVDDEVDEDEADRRDEDSSLDHGEIAAIDRVECQLPDPGPVEDELDDVGAGEDEARLEADQGHERQGGHLQSVHEEDASLREAPGAGGAHVILAKRLEERLAHGPDEDGRQRDGKSRDRQNKAVGPAQVDGRKPL